MNTKTSENQSDMYIIRTAGHKVTGLLKPVLPERSELNIISQLELEWMWIQIDLPPLNSRCRIAGLCGRRAFYYYHQIGLQIFPGCYIMRHP
jgi:hypothetical protein